MSWGNTGTNICITMRRIQHLTIMNNRPPPPPTPRPPRPVGILSVFVRFPLLLNRPVFRCPGDDIVRHAIVWSPVGLRVWVLCCTLCCCCTAGCCCCACCCCAGFFAEMVRSKKNGVHIIVSVIIGGPNKSRSIYEKRYPGGENRPPPRKIGPKPFI